MSELPVCRWREEPTVDGHHKCGSTKLNHGPNGVLDSLCSACHLRDHEPETPEQIDARKKLVELNSLDRDLANFPVEQLPKFLSWIGDQAKLGASMVKSYKRWWLAGRPRPTEHEITERQAACDACPHLQGAPGRPKPACGGSDQPTCGLCGCPLGSVSVLFGLMNRPGKLEMSTEVCPDDPPRWRSLV